MRQLVKRGNGLSVWRVEGESWTQIDGWGQLTSIDQINDIIVQGKDRYKGRREPRYYLADCRQAPAHIVRFTEDDPEVVNEYGVEIP